MSRDAPDRSLSGTQPLEPDPNIEDGAADSAWPLPLFLDPPPARLTRKNGNFVRQK